MHVLVADLWRGKLRHHGWRVAAVGAAAVQSPGVALHRHLHHRNSTPRLFCTGEMCNSTGSNIHAVICNHRNSKLQLLCTERCVTLHAQIFKQLPATTQTAHLSYSALQNVSQYRLKYSSSYLQPHKQHTCYSALQNVSQYRLKYSSSYLQPHKQHTSVILHCKMCHIQIFLQLPAALEHYVYGVTDLC